MSDELLTTLMERRTFLSARPSADHPAVNCPASHLVAFLRDLRDAEGFEMLLDVTAVDWAESRRPRFTCVYHLFDLERSRYLRVASDCHEDANPTMPSVAGLWATADWHERETYDMFGIRFEGHPDLRRILMWDGYPYYPLRKDFPLAGEETDLPGADVAEHTDARVSAAPMAGGPFVSGTSGGPMSEREPRAKDESWTENAPKPKKPDPTKESS